MKEIFDFINNNAIVASLITLFITTIIQIVFRKSDRRYSEKQESKKERKQQFLNKAEFHIEEKQWDSKEEPDICLFITDFKASINDKKDVEFHYSKDILKKEKYKHLRFYIKNIGNADVNQLDICATAQKNTMLCNIAEVKFLVDNKLVNYSICYDRKILKNDIILIDITYLDNSKICNMFSGELALIFRDSYNNLYEQPLFIQQRNLYEPHTISYQEYKIYTMPDTALECFKKPWLW